jgi:hypothetical protein
VNLLKEGNIFNLRPILIFEDYIGPDLSMYRTWDHISLGAGFSLEYFVIIPMLGFRYAHSGMLAAALWLLENEGQTLQRALEAHPVSNPMTQISSNIVGVFANFIRNTNTQRSDLFHIH